MFLFPVLFIAQRPPAASAARILLLPRHIVAGDRATLGVLDVNGRLTPGVTVHFSNGEQYTTDSTGRARFVAPLTPGILWGTLPGRPGRVPTTIFSAAEAAAIPMQVSSAPRVASLSDRFELSGNGFCGDADANQVTLGGQAAIVLAASPVSLVVLASPDLGPGVTRVEISCAGRSAPGFSLTLASLELVADSSPLAPAEHRTLTVHIHGSSAPLLLEARNLSPEVATLTSPTAKPPVNVGVFVRAVSSGGAENVARFEMIGKQRGNFLISIRLIVSPGRPRP